MLKRRRIVSWSRIVGNITGIILLQANSYMWNDVNLLDETEFLAKGEILEERL